MTEAQSDVSHNVIHPHGHKLFAQGNWPRWICMVHQLQLTQGTNRINQSITWVNRINQSITSRKQEESSI